MRMMKGMSTFLEEYDGNFENGFRDMETTRRVSSEMGLAVHGDLGCDISNIHIQSFLLFTAD